MKNEEIIKEMPLSLLAVESDVALGIEMFYQFTEEWGECQKHPFEILPLLEVNKSIEAVTEQFDAIIKALTDWMAFCIRILK